MLDNGVTIGCLQIDDKGSCVTSFGFEDAVPWQIVEFDELEVFTEIVVDGRPVSPDEDSLIA